MRVRRRYCNGKFLGFQPNAIVKTLETKICPLLCADILTQTRKMKRKIDIIAVEHGNMRLKLAAKNKGVLSFNKFLPVFSKTVALIDRIFLSIKNK